MRDDDAPAEMVPVTPEAPVPAASNMTRWREKVRRRTVSAVKAQLKAQRLMPQAVKTLGSILTNEEVDEKGRRIVSAGEQVAAARLVSDIAAQSELIGSVLETKRSGEDSGPRTVVNILNYAGDMTEEDKAVIRRLALQRLKGLPS